MKPLARDVGKHAWRVGIAVTGGMVVLAGVAMLVLPGPGLLAIAAGLALLAVAFDAARELRDRLIRWVRARGRRRRA